MDKNLQQRLAKVLDGNNKEAAWTMGRRYLSEETLYWAMEANYPSANLPDREYDVERFIEAWESNTDYEIVMPGDFEGKADIAVGRDYSMDCVKVTLYGASTEDGEPGLYAALLRHVADWIEKNAGAVCAREKADCGIVVPDGFTTDENPFKNEFPEWMGLGSDGADGQEDIPEHTEITVTLTTHTATPVVTLYPGAKRAPVSIEKKENNTSMLERCAICGDHFEAELGLWPFIAGTWNPVCMTCCDLIEKQGEKASF